MPQISQLPISAPARFGWEDGTCCPLFGEMGEVESVMARFFGGSSLESHSGPRCQWFGNGSFASSITNPSMTCVRTFGLIIAFGRPPLSVVPVLLWGGSPVAPPVPVLPPGVVGGGGFVVLWDVGFAPATVAVLVGGVAAADSNPLALTVTGAGAVTGATLVTDAAVAAAAAVFAMVVVVDAPNELVVVVVNEEALVVVVVCGAVVVVLTAPAGSSDEATAGCCCPVDAADAVVPADGGMDTDAGDDAVAACVGVATDAAAVVDVVVVVVVKGAGDEVSIGVGPFNCASDALSAAAAVF